MAQVAVVAEELSSDPVRFETDPDDSLFFETHSFVRVNIESSGNGFSTSGFEILTSDPNCTGTLYSRIRLPLLNEYTMAVFPNVFPDPDGVGQTMYVPTDPSIPVFDNVPFECQIRPTSLAPCDCANPGVRSGLTEVEPIMLDFTPPFSFTTQ